jgi:hypothetical protein
VLRYRTQFDIPPDRYVRLLLPRTFPEGRAMVTVVALELDKADEPKEHAPEAEDADVEWWEEFDDEPERQD